MSTFEELCQKMESEGWTRKDFKDSHHYRGWYYRNRKKVERSGAWVIDHPLTFWYRPLNSEMALRTCIDCGLEARTEDDLELFMKKKSAKHGRRHLCKTCCNKRLRHRTLTDDRVYLLRKLDNMKRRCYYPNVEAYPLYGGRGITICQEWLDSPNAFIDWALANGFRRYLQIDRIDNDGGYSPDNCRWVTSRVQNRNTRGNVTDFEKGTRICGRCKVKKPLEEFHRAKGNPAGRMYVCKECRIV